MRELLLWSVCCLFVLFFSLYLLCFDFSLTGKVSETRWLLQTDFRDLNLLEPLPPDLSRSPLQLDVGWSSVSFGFHLLLLFLLSLHEKSWQRPRYICFCLVWYLLTAEKILKWFLAVFRIKTAAIQFCQEPGVWFEGLSALCFSLSFFLSLQTQTNSLIKKAWGAFSLLIGWTLVLVRFVFLFLNLTSNQP